MEKKVILSEKVIKIIRKSRIVQHPHVVRVKSAETTKSRQYFSPFLLSFNSSECVSGL